MNEGEMEVDAVVVEVEVEVGFAIVGCSVLSHR